MSNLAVDFGFGNIKIKGDTMKISMRSAIAKTNDGYVIGEKALRTGRIIHIQTITDLLDFYPIVIEKLISDGSFVYPDIAVGLPLESWQNMAIKTDLHNRIAMLRNIGNVYVYPQAMAVPVVRGDDGLVIDIGHNTVISCLVKSNQVAYSKTYYRRGALEIASRVNELLKHELTKVGKTLTSIELDEVIMRGKFQMGLDVYDIDNEISRLKQEYIKDILSLVISDLKVNAGVVNFDTVYLIGGLAKDMDISSRKVKIVVVEDPIYANVDAFYSLVNLKMRL
jgi:hypothetical protein